jgi:uncharacterized membrane protein YgdD (TMEM256/DUF423 family)
MGIQRKIVFFLFAALFIGGGFVIFSGAQNLYNLQTDQLSLTNSMIAVSTEGIIDPANGKHMPAALVSLCSKVILDSKESIIPSFAGSPAVLVFACSKSGLPAFFTTFSRSTSTRPVTPLFVIPAGWALSIGIAMFKGDCSYKDRMMPLVSGSPITLKSGSPYVYCMSAQSASNFTSFSITWV